MHLLIGWQTLLFVRQLQLNSVNNMAWRVKPEEVLIEVGKLFGSKIGLQKLNYEVWDRNNGCDSHSSNFFPFRTSHWHSLGSTPVAGL